MHVIINKTKVLITVTPPYYVINDVFLKREEFSQSSLRNVLELYKTSLISLSLSCIPNYILLLILTFF
jgi:hypothetical protein